ncbi:fork head domain-containing protein [Rhodocollybia butyracea]|uniref:Fork head domain-containing protein n=1 Tax=Rhodocollybia butyracea TaxID=206335 RepID=A0A9P5PEE0_9AGAR|nr:fork head domain-containing protein [Rhodocollybia butyracea]
MIPKATTIAGAAMNHFCRNVARDVDGDLLISSRNVYRGQLPQMAIQVSLSLWQDSHRPSHGLFGGSDLLPDAGPTLRSAYHIPPGIPINLHVIPDPPPGKKPDAQLETLVQLAIYGSARRKLTLQEIYSAIEDRFEYYRHVHKWKSSIRHMLSLKSVFVPTERPASAPGRGKYWQIDANVTFKYKRPRRRGSGKRGPKGTARKLRNDLSLNDYDDNSCDQDMRRTASATDATFGFDDFSPLVSNMTRLLQNGYGFLTPSAQTSLTPYPSVVQPKPFDFEAMDLGLQHQPPALINPSCDVWWGQTPTSSFSHDHSIDPPKPLYRLRSATKCPSSSSLLM